MRKEIGLLRFVFWIAAAFVLAAAAYSAAAFLHFSWIAESSTASPGVLPIYSHVHRSRDAILVLGALAFLSQLILVPALCGGLAFAEETYFGTHAWQLSQPVSPARRWLIKFAAASGLNILAGLLLPVGFYLLLLTVLPKGYLVWDDIVSGWDQVLPQLVGGNLLVFAFAAWCGSWSRSTAGALAKAFLMILGLVMLVRLAFEAYGPGGPIDWRVTAVATSVAALAMTFSNLRLPEVPARQWAIQLLALALVAAIISFPYADYLTRRYLSDFLNGT